MGAGGYVTTVVAGYTGSSAAAGGKSERTLMNCFVEACSYSCCSDGGGTSWLEQRRYKPCEHSGHGAA